METISKDKLVKLISKLSAVRKKRFKRNKITKYGNLSRSFSDSELSRFFNCCTHKKAHLAFYLMAHLGLRVGEIVNIKITDLNFTGRKIRIETEKAKTTDFLYLHDRVRKILLDWVQKFQQEIKEHSGYILFSESLFHKRNHISPHWLRKEFREICVLANLNETYGQAEDQPNQIRRKDGQGRTLYRLTTHSLRHYYITHIYKKCKNPVITQRLARHQDFKSTQVYINITQDEIDKTMQEVFETNEITTEEKKEVEELVEFFEMWRKVKIK
ncbi:site-specific integrase [archaeon]|nr:site-specific integrase [archaeon]